MVFLSNAQVITALGAVILALWVLELVRRRRLSEEYSLLWLVASFSIAILGFSTPLLQWITRVLGVLYENSTVFAVGLAFAVLMLLHLSVKLSRMQDVHDTLTRELALVRAELDAVRDARGGEAR